MPRRPYSGQDDKNPPVIPHYLLGRLCLLLLAVTVAGSAFWGIPIPNIDWVYDAASWVTVAVLAGALFRTNNSWFRRAAMVSVVGVMASRAAWWVFWRPDDRPVGSAILAASIYVTIAVLTFTIVLLSEVLETIKSQIPKKE